MHFLVYCVLFDRIESLREYGMLYKGLKGLPPCRRAEVESRLSPGPGGVVLHMASVLCLLGLPFSYHPLFFQGQSRARHHGQCCEECVSPARTCSSGGVLWYQDEMWKGSACEFCMCDQGQVTCQTGECAKVACALVRSEGISICPVAAPPSRW